MKTEEIESLIASAHARAQIVRRSPGASQRELDLALSIDDLATAMRAMLVTPPPWLFVKQGT